MRANKGFTLIELLVVMTLLSLLMTGLISAMRTMAQTETRIDQRFTRLNETRVIHNFVKEILVKVSAAKINAPDASGKTRIPFYATPDSLTWVGVMPARPDVGGLHFFRLAVESDDRQQALVLRFAPVGSEMQLPDWSAAESRRLLPDITELKIQAQGLPLPNSESFASWPTGWQDGWPVADALPEQLRLETTSRSGEVTTLTLAVHALAKSDSSLSVTIIGGSTR